MWKISLALAVVLLCVSTAFAVDLNLQLSGEQATADSNSSCWITLRVANTGIEKQLRMWSLLLEIVPDFGYSGSVSIADFAKPADYVFGDLSVGIFPFTEGYMFSDGYYNEANPSSGGIDVSSSGANLLQIELMPVNAKGRFNVLVVPNDDNGVGSNWISDDGETHDFSIASVSDRPNTAIVASVEFGVVPEPPCGRILLSGIVVLTLLGFARKKWSHRTSNVYAPIL